MYMLSTPSLMCRASALAGRALRQLVEMSVVIISASLVSFALSAIYAPNIIDVVLNVAVIPVLLIVIMADLWGNADLWDGFYFEGKRFGMYSPINVIDYYIVQPLQVRIEKKKNRKMKLFTLIGRTRLTTSTQITTGRCKGV